MSFANLKRKNAQTIAFTMAPTHVAYANTLRRLMMTGVETIGFRADMTDKGTTSDVKVLANDTPMTNEMFAHRIGLLPVHVPDPLAWKPEQYMFRLSVEADKEASRDVTCADFKIQRDPGEGRELEEVAWDTLFPPNPITRETCLLATLPAGGGKISLEAKASLGTGRENARWQPTSQCTYTYTRDTGNVPRLEEHLRKWLKEAKKLDLDGLDKTQEPLKSLLREFNTMEINRVFLENEKGEPYSFDFVVESVGVLDPIYIVQRACEVGQAMVSRYVNIHTAGNRLPEELVILPTTDCDMTGYDFVIKGHDHTLGNLLQTWLSEKHMADAGAGAGAAAGDEIARISFAGYAVPHPLRDEMVVRIGVEDGKEETARRAFAQACKGCAEMFESLRSAWQAASGGARTASRRLRASIGTGNAAKAREAVLAAMASMQAATADPQTAAVKRSIEAAAANLARPSTAGDAEAAIQAAISAISAQQQSRGAGAGAAAAAAPLEDQPAVAEAKKKLNEALASLNSSNEELKTSYNNGSTNNGSNNGRTNNGSSENSWGVDGEEENSSSSEGIVKETPAAIANVLRQIQAAAAAATGTKAT
jgi:DNA-directed RNA polymerase subunit L